MADNDEPFMEHPTGEFPDAVSAMTSAIERLRSLETWDRWIAFSGQGQGERPESYHVEEIRLRGDEIDVGGRAIDWPTALREGGISPSEVPVHVDLRGVLQARGATAEQLARLLHGLFLGQLGIRPFDDEGDYAVGAEWCDE